MSYDIEALLVQIAANQSANLLHPRAPERLSITPRFEALLRSIQTQSPTRSERARFIHAAALLGISSILKAQQYLQISRPQRRALYAIYSHSLQTILDGASPARALRDAHFPALKAWLEGVYPRKLSERIRSLPRIDGPLCCEYSAALQWAALGLDRIAAPEPILDIACGQSATLVKFLRAQGRLAEGFDRLVLTPEPGVAAGDWFDFPYGRARWGLILSHMGFSNHYRHAAQYDPELQERYNVLLCELLVALKPGGLLALAPAHPNLDAIAHERGYFVTAIPIQGEYYAAHYHAPE